VQFNHAQLAQEVTVMQLPTSPRLATSLAVGATIVVTVALTLGILGFTRAGTVSVLPVTGQQSGIAVCGHGKATTKPDQARIQAGVHATSASAQDARGQAAAAMTAVIAALKSHGVADGDIQTDYFAIQPQYTYESSGPRQTGYMATNNVTATIRHVDDAGKVVDAVTQAGGNAVVVSGIQFFSGDPSSAQAAAQTNALADAHSQAQRIADGAGVHLGAALSIQVGGCDQSGRVPIGFSADQAAGASVTTPIQQGQQETQVTVAVVYAMR
jgi:uncharacterized protein